MTLQVTDQISINTEFRFAVCSLTLTSAQPKRFSSKIESIIAAFFRHSRARTAEERERKSHSAGLRWRLMEPVMSAFMLYVFGFFVLLGGLGYAAYLLHVPQTWIIVGALVLIGMGVMSAVARTKQRDPPQDAPKA